MGLTARDDRHPSICRYVYSWYTKEWSYYAMEYYANGSLFIFMRDRLNFKNFPLTLTEKADIMNHLKQRSPSSPSLLPDTHIYTKMITIQFVMTQIISVLAWLHKTCSICHLDLSLENIMICNSDIRRPLIKIIDFGVAVDFSQTPKEVGYYADSSIARNPKSLEI